MFARTSELERRMPRRTSGAAVRRSCTTNAPRMAAAPASEPSVRAEAQPASGASTTVNTSSSIPAVTAIAPATSKLPFVRQRGPGRHQADRRDERDERQRDWEQEHPAPAQLGEQAAEDEPEREAGGTGGR